jgi:HTH-type transcriptional regulator/antitoxin HigA
VACDCDTSDPGQLINSLLEERGWDQRALAAVVGIDTGNLNRVISGKRRVDAETAIVLSEAFGVEPERFLELQQAYDLAKARIEVIPDPSRATRAELFGQLPIAEMFQRGWLHAENAPNIPGTEAALAKFSASIALPI